MFSFLFSGVGCGSHPVTTDDDGGIGPDYFPLFIGNGKKIEELRSVTGS